MVIRLSFTMDTPLAERIDQYAKNQDIDRNEAVLTLLEAGLARAESEGLIPEMKERDYKRELQMQKSISMITSNLDDLKKEIRAMHHLIDMNQKNQEKKHNLGNKR